MHGSFFFNISRFESDYSDIDGIERVDRGSWRNFVMKLEDNLAISRIMMAILKGITFERRVRCWYRCVTSQGNHLELN